MGKVVNAKVKNATRVELDGIKFRSKLEAYTYSKFKEAGLTFEYESMRYVIIEKFEYNGTKHRACTYTPDFIDNDNKIMVEVKGWETDTFKLKWKLFQHRLHLARDNWTIYMVKSQKQVNELIKQLKDV